ncbi:ABC transporter permease [bacterium]|nr:ABC transporter permease [bacterium]
MFWSNISKIFFAELKKIFTDKGAFLIMFIGIILYSVAYGLTYYNQVVRNVPVGVIDLDNSQMSRQLIRDLDATEQISVAIRPESIPEAKKDYEKDKIKAFVIIPTDFEKDILSGKGSNIVLEADSSYMIVYRQVYTGVMTTVSTMSAKIAIVKNSMKTGDMNTSLAGQIPFEFIQIPLFNPSSGYENYVFPTILILALQQTMLVGVGLLIGRRREKEDRFCEFTDDSTQIVLGRGFAYVFLYTIYASVYFLVYPSLFGYGLYINLPLMFPVMFLFLFATAFCAQSLGIFYNNKEDSLLALVMSSITLVFLAGVVWRKEDIPFLLRVVSDFIPSTKGVDALVRINQMGANLSEVLTSVLWLAALTVLFFFLAQMTTKKLVEEKVKKEV